MALQATNESVNLSVSEDEGGNIIMEVEITEDNGDEFYFEFIIEQSSITGTGIKAYGNILKSIQKGGNQRVILNDLTIPQGFYLVYQNGQFSIIDIETKTITLAKFNQQTSQLLLQKLKAAYNDLNSNK